MRFMPAHRKRRRHRADRATMTTAAITLTAQSVRVRETLPTGDSVTASFPRDAFATLPPLESDERAVRCLPATVLTVEMESPAYRTFRRFCHTYGIAWQQIGELPCPQERVRDGNTGRWKELATGPALLTFNVDGNDDALFRLRSQPWIVRHFLASRIAPPRVGSGAGEAKPIPRPKGKDHTRADAADRIAGTGSALRSHSLTRYPALRNVD